MSLNFIILSTQRSGSTWVVDMLNSHPAIMSYSELLLENGKGKPTWGGRKDFVFFHTYLEERKELLHKMGLKKVLFQYLDELYASRNAIKAVGFKLMYGQAGAYDGLLDYLVTKDVVIIHLIRRNILDVIISKEAAMQRDVFHSRTNQVFPLKLHINLNNILDCLSFQEEEIKKAQNKFSNINLLYHEVYYEDLRHNEDSFEVLLDFLEINHKAQPLNSSLKKLNHTSHSQLIENYEQLKTTLKGTRYEALLNN